MGISSITFYDFTIGNIAILPDSILYCLIGSSISNITDFSSSNVSNIEKHNLFLLIITIVMSVIAFIGMIIVGFIAKKKYNELVNNMRMEREGLINEENDV